MPPSWGARMDVVGKYAGSLSGSMNTVGNLTGFVAPSMVAYTLQSSNDDCALTFFVFAGIYCAGMLCWVLIDPIPAPDEPATAAAPASAR